MMPVLFRIPGINYELPGYGVALMVGFLLSIMWAARRAVKSGANPDVILNCGFVALVGGVVGSRFMYVVHYWDQFARHGSLDKILWAILDVRKGGLEVYGGVIACTIIVFVYFYRWRHSARWYLDIIAPSAALGMAIGRIGCFLNGCCWGGVCQEIPWSVRFPYGSPPALQQWSDALPEAGLPKELVVMAPGGEFYGGAAAYPIVRESLRLSDERLCVLLEQARRKEQLELERRATNDAAKRRPIQAEIAAIERQHGADLRTYHGILSQMQRYDLSPAQIRALAQQHPSLPTHPTQLYSAITLGLLAAMLATLYWRRTRDGQVIFTLLLVEPPTRWMLEVLRADNPVDTAGLTVSQFLAIGISLVGLLGLIWLHYLPPRSPHARIWVPEEVENAESPARTASGG